MTSMPFGQYHGWPLPDVPLDYLKWCLENLTSLRPAYRRAIEDEVDYHHAAEEHATRRRKARERVTALSAYLETTWGSAAPTTWASRSAALGELVRLRGVPFVVLPVAGEAP
jgi:hypothetical protein